jgi:beta-lactamase regulating signal transducer with metallopeptidase domain
MQTPVLNEIFSGKIVQALCWMLVHSLWLGLALTVLTGAIIVATKNKSAALRYNLLVGALLVFTTAVGIAFMFQLSTGAPAYDTAITDTATSIITGSNNVYTVHNVAAGFSNTVIVFFNNNAAVVVWCWVLIIAFRCVQFAGGLYKIKQIKTTQLTPVNDYWNLRLAHFAATLKINNTVQLLQSGLAKMPMVVGHFKPVILFPLGLLATLPAQEVEAVLLHELAHIRRKDYLVNLLQHFMEIVFFFNPAVLWISSLIRAERENCCDDIAIAHAGSKRNYINALVSFQEYQLHASMQYATALGNDKNQLLQRVKRMLYNNNKTLNNMEKTILAVCFAATTSLAILFTTTTTAQTNGNANKITRDAKLSAATKQDKEHDKKIQAETLALKLQQEKLSAERSSLLNQLEKLKAEELTKPGADTVQIEKHMQELTEQLDVLKQQQQQLLSNEDAIKSAQLQSVTQLDKLKAEQLQLKAQQEKFNAEKFNKDAQKQNQLTVLQKKELELKIEAEEKQMELDAEKQKVEQRQMQIEQEEAVKEQKQAALEQQQAAIEQQQAAVEQKQAAIEQAQAVKEQKQAVKEQRKAAKEQKKAAKDEAKQNKKDGE